MDAAQTLSGLVAKQPSARPARTDHSGQTLGIIRNQHGEGIQVHDIRPSYWSRRQACRHAAFAVAALASNATACQVTGDGFKPEEELIAYIQGHQVSVLRARSNQCYLRMFAQSCDDTEVFKAHKLSIPLVFCSQATNALEAKVSSQASQPSSSHKRSAISK
jgi:hypothetical protein